MHAVGFFLISTPAENPSRHSKPYIREFINTVCPGSSDPPEKIYNIFASVNEVYTIYQILR
mgnify:CR=1 FL=1